LIGPFFFIIFVQTFFPLYWSNISEMAQLNKPMSEEERKLILRAQKGDLPAFESLITRYDSKVMSVAITLLNNTEDAEDVYQEVFTKVYQKLHTFQFKSNFYTWLYRIAFNTAITYRNTRKRLQHQSLEKMESQHFYRDWIEDPAPGPDSRLLDKDVTQAVRKCVSRLPLMQRVVFHLRFFEDFKIKDIAQITGRSTGTIKNYIFRSTKKIQKELSPYTGKNKDK